MTSLECISEINWRSVADLSTILSFFGIVIASLQIYWYRKELKNKTFIEFRQRFKADKINLEIFDFLTGGETNIPSDYQVNHFLGFYEELHKMYEDGQISIDDLVYFFGNYYVKVMEHADLSTKAKLNSTYWTRAVDMYQLIKRNQSEVLKKISSKYNHKDNLQFLENKNKL